MSEFALSASEARRSIPPAATLHEELWRREQARREATLPQAAGLEPPLVALAMSLARLAARIDVQRRTSAEGARDV